MDLDTFFTELYVLVDDWYQQSGYRWCQRRDTGRMRMSDSEVLTVALAGQWRVGVPWRSERGLLAYLQAHGRGWFPSLLRPSAFNRRVRSLWATFIQLQQDLADRLAAAPASYEVVDCFPLPAYSLGQAHSRGGHSLWWSTKGHGGTQGGWYIGDALLLACTPQGAITGWLVCPANADDRWNLQAFLSQRAGQMHLAGPAPRPRTGKQGWLTRPAGQFLPPLAVGSAHSSVYLADRGFNGARWQRHWQQWQARVLSIPPANAPEAAAWSPASRRWLNTARQCIETVFAHLTDVFGAKRLRARSRAGQLARVAAMTAAYNLGLWLNRQHGRRPLALATLIC
jgi:hypothetical protein